MSIFDQEPDREVVVDQEQRWRANLAWIGAEIEVTGEKSVRVRCGAIVSDWDGDSVGDALSCAAGRLNICWPSVERKRTEAAWAGMAHL